MRHGDNIQMATLSLSVSVCLLPVIEHSKHWTMCNQQHNAHTHMVIHQNQNISQQQPVLPYQLHELSL